MPPDNQHHTRRPHYHRGRRGPDRRSPDRRPTSPSAETPSREHLDIEQLMREIRSRIADRTGVDLTNQQIQELAAHRLEAILDPTAMKPALLDELRRASGQAAETPAEPRPLPPAFDEAALYESSSGALRFIRRLLNPVLRLLIAPEALVRAFSAQAESSRAAAARDAADRRRQAEWNALHFEILRRVVLDVARTEIDAQGLSQRVESLGAKVDFNERRVRTIEQAQLLARPGKPPESQVTAAPPQAPREEAPPQGQSSGDGSPAGAGRRRRRRRRGRRSPGGPMLEGGVGPGQQDTGSQGSELNDDSDDADDDVGPVDEGGEDLSDSSQTASAEPPAALLAPPPAAPAQPAPPTAPAAPAPDTPVFVPEAVPEPQPAVPAESQQSDAADQNASLGEPDPDARSDA